MNSSRPKNTSSSSSSSSTVTLEQIEKRIADTNRREDELTQINDIVEKTYEELDIWKERANIIVAMKKHSIPQTMLHSSWRINKKVPFEDDFEIHCLRHAMDCLLFIRSKFENDPPISGSRHEEILKIVMQYRDSFAHPFYALCIQNNLKNRIFHPLLTENFLRESSTRTLSYISTLIQETCSSFNKNRFQKFITYLNKYPNEKDRTIICEVLHKLNEDIKNTKLHLVSPTEETLKKRSQDCEKLSLNLDKLLDSPEIFLGICTKLFEAWESKGRNLESHPFEIDYDQFDDLLANFATHQTPIKSEIKKPLPIEGVHNVVLDYLGYDKSINPLTFFNNPPFEKETETKAPSVAHKNQKL